MHNSERPETLTKAKERNSFNVSGQLREGEEAATRYAMFIIGAASFFTGFWAAACLLTAMLHTGPLSIIKQLAAAITGR